MRGKLKLRAVTAEDLRLVSACLQDALVTVSDMNWFGAQLRFAVLANRFRWEAALEEGSYERTHAMLSFQNVTAVRRRGIDPRRSDRILNLLAVTGEGGEIELAFAGDAAVRLATQALDCIVEDLGEPWPTKWRPSHEGTP